MIVPMMPPHLETRGEGLDAAEGDEGREPVDREHDAEHEHVVGGQRLVPALVRTDEGQRYGAEGEPGRKPDRHLDPEHEHGDERPSRTEGLADPAEDAAFLRPAGRKLGRDQRNRDQEDDRREKVVEDRAEAVFGLRRQAL